MVIGNTMYIQRDMKYTLHEYMYMVFGIQQELAIYFYDQTFDGDCYQFPCIS